MHFFGPVRVDGFTHQLQLHCNAHPDRVDQPHDAPVGEMHAPAHVEEPEVRVLGGDPDVAGQGQFDAAPDDPAVERRDDRFGRPMQPSGDPAREPLLQQAASEFGPGVEPGIDMRFEVGARAEGLVPGPGEDRDSDIRIVAEICPRLEQQLIGLGVDGVVDLGPVQRDVCDLIALFVDHLGHGSLSGVMPKPRRGRPCVGR